MLFNTQGSLRDLRDYVNRSRALQSAMDMLSEREKRSRLARELAKLNPAAEKRMAEEGLGDSSWPGF